MGYDALEDEADDDTSNCLFMSKFSSLRVWAYWKYSRFIRWKMTQIYGMDIGYNVKISRRAVLDYSLNPKGVHIGDNTIITGNVVLLAHDHVRGLMTDTYIGTNCFLGGGCIIMPGIKIGNHVIVGAGSVVTKDVPDHSVVAGNPAKVIRTGVILNNNCQIINNGTKV